MSHGTLSPSLAETLREVDAQISKKKAAPPPGDRRRMDGKPPDGMQERRSGIERRNRAKSLAK